MTVHAGLKTPVKPQDKKQLHAPEIQHRYKKLQKSITSDRDPSAMLTLPNAFEMAATMPGRLHCGLCDCDCFDLNNDKNAALGCARCLLFSSLGSL